MDGPSSREGVQELPAWLGGLLGPRLIPGDCIKMWSLVGLGGGSVLGDTKAADLPTPLQAAVTQAA